MIYGYARVSTKDQNEERQIIALKAAGITEIFVDKESGKDFERKAYKSMCRKAKKGDVIVFKSLDRFGRDYKEVQEQWRKLIDKGIDIKILDMPLLDTTNHKDLIGTLISDIVLQLLAYVAQTERERIKERQREGIEAAIARGVHFGRPQRFYYEDYIKVFERCANGEITCKQAATEIGCCENVFFRMWEEYKSCANIEIRRKVKNEKRRGLKPKYDVLNYEADLQAVINSKMLIREFLTKNNLSYKAYSRLMRDYKCRLNQKRE